MEAEVLKTVGQIAGIGGLALGVFLLLYRDIIRKNIFPTLPPNDAYRLLRLITIAVWSVAIVGIGAWVYVSAKPTPPGPRQDAKIDGNGNSLTQTMTIPAPPAGENKAEKAQTVDGKSNVVVQEKIK